MRKRNLLFASLASVAVIVSLLVSALAGAGSVETAGANSSGKDGSSMIDAATQTRQVTFSGPGKVAVFDVTVTGSGVLMVDTADWNPSNYADYWRTTIVVMRESGPGSWAVTDYAATWIGTAGTGTGWGVYSGRADMLVISGYTYIVQVSYDWGSDTWGAACLIRFRYTGPTMTITGPRTGF